MWAHPSSLYCGNELTITHAIQLCRFYKSLVNMSFMDPNSDADSTEIRHFSLRNARIGEANSLFRMLGANHF